MNALRHDGQQDRRECSGSSPESDACCEDDFSGEAIVCRCCGRQITSIGMRISINGAHEHTFANPEGILFQIGCFSTVLNCLFHGKPTEQWTWFAGYRWQVTYCAGCGSHLGWRYTAVQHCFHGLVLSSISTTS